MFDKDLISSRKDSILITGANGFIGTRVLQTLLDYGFGRIRCFVRPSSNLQGIKKVLSYYEKGRVEIFEGNLLTKEDCEKAAEGICIVYNLAAGKGEKSYPSAYMNSVVTTRNLIEACKRGITLKRIVNVSSFAVYSNRNIRSGGLLDETCEIETRPKWRGEAYTYAKVKQDDLVMQYRRREGLPCVFVRPGAVYGPGDSSLTWRIGIDTFGIFLHLGGSNFIPLTYVDNCAEAIVLAGLVKGIDGEVFNIVDDDLPRSRTFLKMYKKSVKNFPSIWLPKAVSYFFCYIWEKYSEWSKGQLPPAFNRNRWANDWKGNRYSNEKIKKMLGWKQKVPFSVASKNYFEYCKNEVNTDA